MPSPAPNGRVPSPAPSDAAAAAYSTLNHSSQFSQSPFLGNTTSIASSTGNVTVPMRATHSSLSTIPEVPAELNRSSNSNLHFNSNSNVISQNKSIQYQQSTDVSSISKGPRQPLMNQPNQKRTLFQQSNRYHPSMSKTIGGGIIRGVHPATEKFQNSSSTRFSVPLTGQSLDTLNSYPPDILVHSTSSGVGPSSCVSSTVPISTNNWQEQSFDSSIVTDSHYDASFESEIPPMGLSIDRGFGPNGGSNAESIQTNQTSSGIPMSSQSNVSNATPLTTSQRQQKKVFQQHKGGSMAQTGFVANDNNETAKMGSNRSGLFGISGFGNNTAEKNPQSTAMQSVNQGVSGNRMSTSMVPSASGSIASSNPKVPASGAGIRLPATEDVAPNSLMLWKKVQFVKKVTRSQTCKKAEIEAAEDMTNMLMYI